MDVAPLAFGKGGAITIDSTSGSKPGEFHTIDCIEDTQFTTISSPTERAGGVTLTSISFPAGFKLYGIFRNVEVASGLARCYYSQPTVG